MFPGKFEESLKSPTAVDSTEIVGEKFTNVYTAGSISAAHLSSNSDW